MCDWQYVDSCIGPGWCWACHKFGDVLLGHFRCRYVAPELRALIDTGKATLWYDGEWHVLLLAEKEVQHETTS